MREFDSTRRAEPGACDLRIVLPVVGLLALAHGAAAAEPVAVVRVEDGRFVAENAAGDAIADADLIGLVLSVETTPGTVLDVRIDGVATDMAARQWPLTLYQIAVRDADGAWQNPCKPGPDGRGLALPLQGFWTTSGDHRAVDGAFTLACTAGAAAKCVRMGYRPWAQGPDGRSLRGLHQACTRMVRADYCGDGRGWTADGTLINVFDSLGIQSRELGTQLNFEAIWSADGAICVAKPRLPARDDLASIEQACPDKLGGRTGTGCSVETAPADALDILFNES